MNALICVLVLPVLGGPLGNPAAEGEKPSPKDLVKLARAIDSRDRDLKSIEISVVGRDS